MRPVTDPELLKALERGEGKVSSSKGLRPVTDPALLRQLSGQAPEEDKVKQYNESLFSPMLHTPASALMQQGIEVGKNPVGRVAEETVAAIPFGLGEGSAALLSRLAAKGASKGALNFADIASMIAKNAGFGAGLNAADVNSADSLAERSGEGALTGGALGAGGRLAGKLLEMLRPSRMLRGSLSPDELKRNLAITEGTKTGLGDVIESPSLKFALENLLRHVPGSGVDKAFAETGNEIGRRAENILASQSPEAIPNAQEKIVEALSKAAERQRADKDALYSEANNIADKIGLKLDLPEFSSLAKKHIESISDSSFLQHEPESKSLMSRLINYTDPVKEVKNIGSIVDSQGNPLINETELSYPSLKEANILAGKLNNLAKQHLSSPDMADRSKGSVLSSLGKALKTDIKETIEKSGSDELKQSFKNAEDNYRKNFSPFLDEDIYKFTHGNKDPQDILSHFIKTGSTNDKSIKLSKLMDKLSPEEQNLVRYGYLSRAIKGPEENRYVDPNALATLWSDTKLGQQQKKALFPDKIMRRQIDNFVDLVKKNPKATNLMFNPATGHSNLLANTLDLLGSTPAGIAAKLTGARVLSGKLTDPAVRERLIKTMLENKKLQGGNVGMGALQALFNGTTGDNQ